MASSATTEQTRSKRMDIRIVVIGKTGDGKSAVGNTILGREAFISKLSPSSVTGCCKRESGEVDGQPVAVIDTPGLCDTNKKDEILLEIVKCISYASPGPHVFLVVFHNRFTKEDQDTLKLIKDTFGPDTNKYTMALITHGDQLKAQGGTIEDLISESPDFRDVINTFRGGYHVFDNKDKDRSQVIELLKKINMMVAKNGRGHYTSKMLEEAEQVILKEIQSLQRRYPELSVAEARRRAEEDPSVINTILTAVKVAAAAAVGVAGVAGMVALARACIVQ